MKNRIFVVLLVVGAVGWFGLRLMQRQLGVGEFAESPQQVRLRPGRRAIVGGGRAVLGLVSENRDAASENRDAARKKPDTVTIEIRCAAETRRVQLHRQGPESSTAVCAVEVRWLPLAFVTGASVTDRVFEVSWDE